ncbi:hypothetical protein, partial [Escherichia coli]
MLFRSLAFHPGTWTTELVRLPLWLIAAVLLGQGQLPNWALGLCAIDRKSTRLNSSHPQQSGGG